MTTKTKRFRSPNPHAYPKASAQRRAGLLELHRVGEGHMAADRLAKAEQAFRRILALRPGDPRAHHQLGLLAYRQKDYTRAAELVAKSIELCPEEPSFHANYGNILMRAERNAEAAAAYRKAIELDPKSHHAHFHFGLLLMQANYVREAEQSFRRALELLPNDINTLGNLASACSRQGKMEEAGKLYEQILQLRPNEAHALHFLNMLNGQEAQTAPQDYVVGLFDGYAEKFDRHLVEGLRYRAPSLLRDAVGRVAKDVRGAWRVLDLGCGTGLCGPLFRDLAAHLSGVDLSPKMLEKARAKHVYDEISEGDLRGALQRVEPGALDLAVSADVLIYVGDLDEVFEACGRALREGGLFAFTIESFPGEGYTLRPSGRFAHSDAYIQALREKHGFALTLREDVVLRMEKRQPLSGYLYILRKGGEALHAAPQEIRIQPESIPEFLQSALLHHQAGHLGEAEAIYREILKAAPGHADALHFLGVIAHQRGDHAEAESFIRRAIENFPDFHTYYANLGLVLQAQGKVDEAIKALMKAIDLDGTRVDPLNNLAVLFKQQGRLGNALKLLTAVITLRPDSPEAHSNLGSVYLGLGRIEEAKQHYEQAVGLNPEDSNALRNLANFHQSHGQPAEAAKCYKRLVKLRPGDAEARRRLEECEAQAAQP